MTSTENNHSTSQLTRMWIAALGAYWLVLFTATHLPGKALVSVPSFNDKLVHFGGYALLSFLLAKVLHGLRIGVWRSGGWTVLAVMFYGVLDELTQIPIPGRTSDVMDWVADTCGAVAGALVYMGFALICSPPKALRDECT